MAEHKHRPVARYSLLSAPSPKQKQKQTQTPVPTSQPKSLPVEVAALAKYSIPRLSAMLASLDVRAPTSSAAAVEDLADAACLVINEIGKRWFEAPQSASGVDAVTRHLQRIVPRGQPMPTVQVVEVAGLYAGVHYDHVEKGRDQWKTVGVPNLIVSTGLIAELADDELGWVLSHELGHLAVNVAPAQARARKSLNELAKRGKIRSWLMRLIGPAHVSQPHIVDREAVTNAIHRRREMLADIWATRDPQSADAGRRALEKLAHEDAILMPKLTAAGMEFTTDKSERSRTHPTNAIRSAIITRAGGLGA